MAAGVKNTKVVVTSAIALGTLTDGVTFSTLTVKCIGGVIAMGNSGVTQSNGLSVPDKPMTIDATITAADLFFIGPGTLELVGVATA